MFLQNCKKKSGYPKISNFGYLVPEITENDYKKWHLYKIV